ncbi:MAG TPA: glycine/sarcosine/betaine reductase component B subunit [Candidatus Dorea gallistercoris]|uniref:Glycine/sarcosine/betaine reductase component B subunit n=1 Tax=Candidatus Dorea gallistercoris TaxID=2838542 RepID=A0A9D1R9H8_9FIRM|nr:glycine/sarcosine/betaine reductase component B subunit [Candidatus Dorea gallistercoris]
MKLEIGNFYVKDIVFGKQLSFDNGVLTINKEEALAFIREDERITEADLYIAKPGDRIRLCPVKEAIEPRVRLDGRGLFPGYTSELAPAGNGVLHALKNCSVLVVGRHWGGFQDGIIDMSGEGQKLTYFGRLNNVVLVADTNEDFEKHEQQKKNDALRRAGHKLAEFIGSCVKELEPEDRDVYETTPMIRRGEEVEKLPSVVYVMQAQSQMEAMGYNDLVYGWDTNHMLPTVMSPTEILDGAIVSGSFMPVSSKWSTYDMQNTPNLRALMDAHGKTINFLGVIMSNLNVALEQKDRAAIYVAQIAVSLGADGAVVAEEGYGNPDADFVGCLVALEDAGVKTVGVTNESTGRDGKGQPLVTLDEKCDAIVSCGNVGELIELPPMETVLGELEALGRDGNSGGWAYDEVLGPSVREDGSIILENNGVFCGDQVCGWSPKQMMEF